MPTILTFISKLNSILSVYMGNMCVILQCLFMRIPYDLFVHTQIWHIYVHLLGCIRVYHIRYIHAYRSCDSPIFSHTSTPLPEIPVHLSVTYKGYIARETSQSAPWWKSSLKIGETHSKYLVSVLNSIFPAK